MYYSVCVFNIQIKTASVSISWSIKNIYTRTKRPYKVRGIKDIYNSRLCLTTSAPLLIGPNVLSFRSGPLWSVVAKTRVPRLTFRRQIQDLFLWWNPRWYWIQALFYYYCFESIYLILNYLLYICRQNT